MLDMSVGESDYHKIERSDSGENNLTGREQLHESNSSTESVDTFTSLILSK